MVQLPASSKSNGAQKSLDFTRVYKKSSPKSKITCYLGERDFFSNWDHSDIIEGAILLSEDFVSKHFNNPQQSSHHQFAIMARIEAIFKFGRDDLEMLGIAFSKTLYSHQIQVYPPLSTVPTDTRANGPCSLTSRRSAHLSDLQQRLIKKLGSRAFPLMLEIHRTAPFSVGVSPMCCEYNKACGVEYELKVFAVNEKTGEPSKRDQVRLRLRRFVCLEPSKEQIPPSIETRQRFFSSPAPLIFECSLDKPVYHFGEMVAVHCMIFNNSNRTVKKIKMTLKQHCRVCVFAETEYYSTICEQSFDMGFPIVPGGNQCRTYSFQCPKSLPLCTSNLAWYNNSLYGNKHHNKQAKCWRKSKQQLNEQRAGNGCSLLERIPNKQAGLLASSTPPLPGDVKPENVGVIVSYNLRVKLSISMWSSVSTELPIQLTHVTSTDRIPKKIADNMTDYFTQRVEDVSSDLIRFDEEEQDEVDVNCTDAGSNQDCFEKFARLRLMDSQQVTQIIS